MKRHTVFAAVTLCLLCCLWPAVATAATAGAPSSPVREAPLGAPSVATGLAAPLVSAPAQAPASAAPSPASWTFAVYANGDNNLEYTWPQFTLRALRALPANADVNVVAMIDWHSLKKGVQLLQFSGGKVTVVASWPDKDFGAGYQYPVVLEDAKVTKEPASTRADASRP